MAGADQVSSPILDSPPAGAGEADAGDRLAEEERKRRRRKIALLLLIAAIVAYLIYRALSGDQSIPGAPAQPRYVSSIYGVAAPMGVAVSPSDDRVYVTESEGRRLVRVFDSSGEEVDTLKPPGHEGKWRLPVYVAINPSTEDVYVSDRLREVVDVYDADGDYLRSFRPGGRLGRGANPLGLAFDAEASLYMTDVSGGRKSHRVLVFGDGEEPLRTIGSRGTFWFPNGLAVDSRGDVYVSDSNNGRLAIFDPDGELLASIRRGVGEGDLGLPRGVAIEDDDRLFVVDTTAHAVKVYEIGDEGDVPTYVEAFGGQGIADGTFQYPNGIAIDGEGRIYVTDRENDRVQVWTY